MTAFTNLTRHYDPLSFSFTGLDACRLDYYPNSNCRSHFSSFPNRCCDINVVPVTKKNRANNGKNGTN